MYNLYMFFREIVKQNKGYDKEFVYHRLMESVRTPNGPRQRIVLNLEKLELAKESWKALANRIEEIISGQITFCAPSPEIEELAQHFAGILVKKMMDSRKVLEEQVSQDKGGIEGFCGGFWFGGAG